MDALLTGTGGADGWPQPDCRCASCRRAHAAGLRRNPGRVVVDGTVEFSPGEPPKNTAGSSSVLAARIEAVPGGWDVTGADGGRLLLAGGPGEVPRPQPGAAPYDIALLDLIASPAQLGWLRRTGLVRERTAVAALYTDHRITSPAELARRCELWRVSHGQDGQLVTGRTGPGHAPLASGIGRPHRTLIIGGARSGKSTEAELRLSGEPAVTYVAAGPWRSSTGTGPDGQPDAEWAARVARHRARRPSWWQTAETLDVAGQLRQQDGALLLDGVGTWLAGLMDEAGLWHEADGAATAGPTGTAALGRGFAGSGPASLVRTAIDDLVDAWRQTSALVVAVTDQVGSGLVPPYPAGRTFRDELGWLNQRLAAESELVLHVVAGRIVPLPG